MEEILFYQNLGQTISSIRIKKGLKQEDLAKHLDLSRPSIVNIEKGNQRPSIFTVIQIAVFLDVEIRDLIPNIKKNKFESINIVSLDIDKNKLFNRDSVLSFFESI